MSDHQFKLQINLTKSYIDEHGSHFLEGVASGPEVDLTDERMSPEALISMAGAIKKRLVEFRDAHKQEWNDDLGEIIDLWIGDDRRLYYKSKLDMNLSGSKDLWYRVHTLGKKYGVSIGGAVIKAGMEYVAELGRQVYTYFDVDLYEISITRQAAYQYSFANAVVKSLPTLHKGKRSLADEVYNFLKENYPANVLEWVKDADWELRQRVPLDTIDMARRPGGRDPDKVKGIAEAIESGKTMDPVVLVNDGTGKLQIADGYHRTLAYQHLNKTSIAAYVASGLEPGGPWEKAMHDAKLNKSLDEATNEESVQKDTVAAEDQSDATDTQVDQTNAEATTESAAESTDAQTAEAEAETATDADAGAEQADTTPEQSEAESAATVTTDAESDVSKALTQANAEVETLQKSLTESQAQVEELTKSVESKTSELTEVTKTLADVTGQLDTVQKALTETTEAKQKAETELTTINARKALAFSDAANKSVVLTDPDTTPAPTPAMPTKRLQGVY